MGLKSLVTFSRSNRSTLEAVKVTGYQRNHYDRILKIIIASISLEAIDMVIGLRTI